MNKLFLILLMLLRANVFFAQCSSPIAAPNNDCSNIQAGDIITGGSINNGDVKYLNANSISSNIAVGVGGTLYICSDITLSIGTGPNLLSLNGGTVIISSCANVTLVSGGSPTYINSGSEIVNYGVLNVTQSGSYIRMDNGAKLYNYGVLSMEGMIFLRDGSIINDNEDNYSFIETISMRMGSGGSAQYAYASSKLCLAENSCLENNVIVNGTSSNWLEYGGGTQSAYLYGTTNLTGNGGSISNDNEINVCTTDSDSRWGTTNYSVVGSATACIGCVNSSPCNIALSVELSTFEGEQSLDKIILDWETYTEYENEFFEVQRLNGENWEAIGVVVGAGTTDQNSAYSFTDDSPEYGINYYRLKLQDVNGEIQHSKMIAVLMNPTSVKVGPNPSDGEINIVLEQALVNGTIQVIDLQGRMVYEQRDLNAMNVSLNLNEYKGAFIMMVSGENHESIHKIVLK